MLCVCHPLRQTRVDRFSAVSMILSSRASQPIAQSKSGDLAFNSFFSLVSVISPFASSVCQMVTRHRANLFTHWDYPLLSKFRFSSTSIALTVGEANSLFCFLCRALERARRRGKAGLGAISACRT